MDSIRRRFGGSAIGYGEPPGMGAALHDEEDQ